MINRVKERFKLEKRIDDGLDTLELRYNGYINETLPMVQELAQMSPLIHIDGDSSVEVVHRSICDKLKYLI
jgi:hypothetical protein